MTLKSWLVGVGVCKDCGRNWAWEDCLVGRQLMLTHIILRITIIATILIHYFVRIMKNTTDTMQHALVKTALMGTVSELH
jgi:hypothetical protein